MSWQLIECIMDDMRCWRHCRYSIWDCPSFFLPCGGKFKVFFTQCDQGPQAVCYKNLLKHSQTSVSLSYSLLVNTILKTAWDRLLSVFMLVAATVLDLLPSIINVSISWKNSANRYLQPVSWQTLGRSRKIKNKPLPYHSISYNWLKSLFQLLNLQEEYKLNEIACDKSWTFLAYEKFGNNYINKSTSKGSYIYHDLLYWGSILDITL